MDEYALGCYRKAGKILSKLRQLTPRIVREGMPILDLCEAVEKAIVEYGGKPAFPCNVSVNEVAAHYTSPPNDQAKIPAGSIVKVDFGAHVDGYIADSAITISFNPKFEPMIQSAQDSLELAIKNIRPGVKASEIGGLIQKHIMSYGYIPIQNLTGHRIGRYLIHSGKTLPNVRSIDGSKVEEGEVYAIEPFTTFKDAEGRVKDADEAYIYKFNREKGVKAPEAKRLLQFIKDSYRTLPFALRWLTGSFSPEELRSGLRELLHKKCLVSYPVLVEASGKPIAQAEHTVIINRGGCEVITS